MKITGGTHITDAIGLGVPGGVNSGTLQSDPPNGIHNHVNTREELKAYDPDLFDFVDRIFKQVEWRWAPPARQDSP